MDWRHFGLHGIFARLRPSLSKKALRLALLDEGGRAGAGEA